MEEGAVPFIEVELNYIMQFRDLQEDAYVSYEGHMDKYNEKDASYYGYLFHTPSGIKEVKYSDVKIYLPYEVYTRNEEEQKHAVSAWKERKTLSSDEYDELVKYFPDEEGKWDKIIKEAAQGGRQGAPELVIHIKYERRSQGGGRRKQPRKSRNKRKPRSTRRR